MHMCMCMYMCMHMDMYTRACMYLLMCMYVGAGELYLLQLYTDGRCYHSGPTRVAVVTSSLSPAAFTRIRVKPDPSGAARRACGVAPGSVLCHVP